MTDPVDALMSGTRGRRLCLEYAARTDAAVHSTVSWLARDLDPSPSTLLRFTGETTAREDIPTFTGADVASLINGLRLTNVQGGVLREALQASVDLARYWQEPDGTDVVAALPAVRGALRRVARHLSAAARDLATAHGPAQFAVVWPPLAEDAPLPADPAHVLTEWTQAQQGEEARSARERPADVRANFSGTWWSVPPRLLTTRGSIRDALELVEDFLGWEGATVVPVRGAGRTLELRSPADWADLCRTYPMEVTASRRHDWFRVTGRDGRWLIPHWERVSEHWDAVHLTTLGYLSAANQLIDVDADRGSVLGGWGPDATIWLTDVAREAEQPRQQWTRAHNDWRWTASPPQEPRTR
jgi:hypothetical protein